MAEIGSNSMWRLLAGREVGLVHLCTQLFPFQKYLQYKPIDSNRMMITAIGVSMVKNILTLIGDQKLGGNDLSFV